MYSRDLWIIYRFALSVQERHCQQVDTVKAIGYSRLYFFLRNDLHLAVSDAMLLPEAQYDSKAQRIERPLGVN